MTPRRGTGRDMGVTADIGHRDVAASLHWCCEDTRGPPRPAPRHRPTAQSAQTLSSGPHGCGSSRWLCGNGRLPWRPRPVKKPHCVRHTHSEAPEGARQVARCFSKRPELGLTGSLPFLSPSVSTGRAHARSGAIIWKRRRRVHSFIRAANSFRESDVCPKPISFQ